MAGASAGAVVCAVITSGSSMWEALEATKVLADDCRRNGTAFRLGVISFLLALCFRQLTLCLFCHFFYSMILYAI